MKLYSPSNVVNPFSVRKFGYGTGQSGGSGTLTPPTLAPVLTVTADLGSNTANLDWTASNKITSPGFGYRIYIDINGGGFTALTTVSGSTLDSNYTPSPDPAGETYSFYIEPFNDAGPATGGGLSNQASIVLPGEGEAPVLTGPGQAQVDETFSLSWNEIPGATEYHLERSVDNVTFSPLSTETLPYYDTSESSTGSLYYRVIPFAGAFEGISSNVWEVSVTLPDYWLLISGFWDDNGSWKDSATWND
jgi:hypothetical protein